MIRFLADENFDNAIMRGLQRRVPEVEILRVQDTELVSLPDPALLEWAAQRDYIILTHDVNTMRGYYYERINAGPPVPGPFLIHGRKQIGEIINSLELIVLASDTSEWRGKIRYLPL